MITLTIPKAAKKLMSYLDSCGGSETSEFYDTNNNPDCDAAREYAEALRDIHTKYLDELVSIEQNYHKVTISLT